MADDKYIKELLSTGTGTEGSLLIPKKIADTLIEESAKFLIPRSEAAMYFGPGDIPGSSIDIDLDTENTGTVRLIGEGAEAFIDQLDVSSINVKPKKYGVGIRITHELLEDGKWNMLQHNLKIFGRRFAENENTLVIAQLDTADNTVSGGASVTIANLTRAIQYLENKDKTATTLAVGVEVLYDLRNIDTFVEANKVGNTDMLQRGFLGTVYGMNVIRVSTNAGMTATTAYVYDRDYAYVIAEKRPLSIVNFDLPTHDLSAATATQRIAVKALRTAAICKITSS